MSYKECKRLQNILLKQFKRNANIHEKMCVNKLYVQIVSC